MMPRPRPPDAPEPRRRSRFGCHNCKKRKIKCDEAKPSCLHCQKQGEKCDYSVILAWPDEKGARKKTEQGTFPLAPPLPPAKQPSNTVSDPVATRPSSGYSVSSNLSVSTSIESSTPQSRPSSSGTLGPGQGHAPPNPWIAFHQFRASPAQDWGSQPATKRRRLSEDSKFYSTPLPSSPGPSHLTVNTWLPSAGNLLSREPRSVRLPSPESPIYSGCPASVPSSPSPFLRTPDVSSFPVDKAIPSSPNNYGFDQGRPDLDVYENDDQYALSIQWNFTSKLRNGHRSDLTVDESEDSDHTFAFGIRPRTADLERRNYYSAPVPVKIPQALEPIPPVLTGNPMHLLYFHHFLNHTARVLVPHDCPENAFRNILPQMALQDENLMKLLLAYSAHHRAKLLKHQEPKNRIAVWVRTVFPALRKALDKPQDKITNTDLAAAIMLSSLEVISPNAFELPNISWSSHLGLARSMIEARGGYHELRHGDRVSYFLSRWFAYLDILGSLSGNTYHRPLANSKSDGNKQGDFDNEDEIDCFMGFTGRCIAVLAEVANLAKDCEEKHRIQQNTTQQQWQLPKDTMAHAKRLEAYLKDIKPTTYRGCSQRLVQSNTADAAVNEAFHYAGLIHLYRRVLGENSNSKPVQEAVRGVKAALTRVDDRSIGCMIFPVFSAGCEAQTERARKTFLTCLKSIELMGMVAARRARSIMETVWETGKTWPELVTGEFMG